MHFFVTLPASVSLRKRKGLLRRHRLLSAAIAVACVVLTVGFGSAARAEGQNGGSIVFSAPTALRLPIGGVTRTIEAHAHTADVVGPDVVFRLNDLAGVATVEFPANCATSGDRVQCPLPDEGGDSDFRFNVTPAQKASAGATGKLHMTVQGVDYGPYFLPDMVITLDDGVDLTVAEFPDGGKVQPGAQLQVPAPLIANHGNRTAVGLRVTFGIGDPTIVPRQYEDCTYTDTAVTCDVATTLAPGFEVELPPFEFSTTADAMGVKGIWVSVAAIEESETPDAAAATAKKAGSGGWGGAPVARQIAARIASETNPDDNGAEYTFEVENTFDVEALGATATGAVGDVVKVVVGAKNNGPGTIDTTRAQEPAWWFYLTVPPGTEVVAVPDRCAGKVVNGDSFEYVAGRLGAQQYQCKHEGFRFPTGTSTTVEFSLKITTVTADATGNVLTDDPDATTPRNPDTKPENDKAAVVINPTSGGGSGGGGSTGGGDSLPITGTNAVALAGVGFGLVVAGGGLYLVSRRRRPGEAE
jgi:LPXTG-motif cell wall-anchored protein